MVGRLVSSLSRTRGKKVTCTKTQVFSPFYDALFSQCFCQDNLLFDTLNSPHFGFNATSEIFPAEKR